MGDPLTDEGIVEKLHYIKQNSSFKISMTNTCHLLSGKMLDAVCKYVDDLKVSCYGVTEDSYHTVHRGALKYEQVLTQILALLNRDNRPRVTMSFLVLPENETEIKQWREKWESKCDAVEVWKPHNWGGTTPAPSTIKL